MLYVAEQNPSNSFISIWKDITHAVAGAEAPL